MAGARLDSWVGADGATDNAAGAAVVMEGARILSILGMAPKRGIRFALWSGEEQGIYGRRAYLDQHLVTRAPATDPALAKASSYTSWNQRFPITPKPEFNALAGHFNLDNGSGRIRGIYAAGNQGVASTFSQWLAPFANMGADKVDASKTGGTDHVFMRR